MRKETCETKNHKNLKLGKLFTKLKNTFYTHNVCKMHQIEQIDKVLNNFDGGKMNEF